MTQVKYRNPVRQTGHAEIYHMITLDERISDGAFRLYCRYIYHAQQKDKCWPGRDHLSKMLKVTPTTISRLNKQLEDAGYITRQRRMGTSSITWIEDAEQIECLKEKAVAELDSRECNKNVTTNVTELKQRSAQKGHREEEQEKKNKKEEIPAGAANVSSEKPLTKAQEPVIIEVTDEGYLSEPCPWCEADIILKNVSKSAAICPSCESPLLVKDADGTVICKPPQKYRNKRRRKIVGDLVPNCPDRLADMMYYAGDKQTIELLVEKNRDMFLECLNWAVGKMALGQIEPNKVVIRAMSWMQTRLKAAPQQQTPTTSADVIKGTGHTPERMEEIRKWASNLN